MDKMAAFPAPNRAIALFDLSLTFSCCADCPYQILPATYLSYLVDDAQMRLRTL